MAMDRHEIELYTKVKIRLDGDQFVAPEDWEAPEGYQPGDSVLLDCTVGQVLFNQALPKDYPWFSGVADKKGLGSLINDLAERDRYHRGRRASSGIDQGLDRGYRRGCRGYA